MITGSLTIALIVTLTILILVLNRREREGDLHTSRRLFHSIVTFAAITVVLALGTACTGVAASADSRAARADSLRSYERKLGQWALHNFAVRATDKALEALAVGREAPVTYDGSPRIVKLVVDEHGALGMATVTK